MKIDHIRMNRWMDRFKTYIAIIVIAFLAILSFLIHTSIEKSNQQIKNIELQQAYAYAQKIETLLKDRTDDMNLSKLSNEEFRQKINKMLNAFMTEEYRYIFALRKRSDKNLHIILDGSLEEQSEFDEPFFPEDDAFLESFRTGKPMLTKYNNGSEGIWRSLIYPIRNHAGEVTSALVLELSESYMLKMESVSHSFRHLSLIMWWTVAILVAITLAVGVYYIVWYRGRFTDKVSGAKNNAYLKYFSQKHTLKEFFSVMIDIDAFKTINDRFGLESGNAVLRKFVKKIKEEFPESIVVRTVGTEFFVLIPKRVVGEGWKNHIELFASKLNKHNYAIGEEKIQLSVSITAAPPPETDEIDVEKMQRILDEKMLVVKSNKWMKVCVINNLDLSTLRYRDFDFVKTILEQGNVTCEYQPIIDMKSSCSVKYEALARFIDPDDPQKLISPYRFMPTIKGTSQYIKLTKLVLDQVFEKLRLYEDVHLSVNLDYSDLNNEDLVNMIVEELKKNQKEANRLTFEIIEDEQIQDCDVFAEIIGRFQSYGASIAIDDFGSGYSSYLYLIKIKWDVIKIDGSLVKEIIDNPETAEPVLASIAQIASQNGTMVVAEFVENETIAMRLKKCGIRYAQGYYFAKPAKLEVFLDNPCAFPAVH